MSDSSFDVIVVGAGFHGLCVSHTFLSLDPTTKLLVVDDKSSVGGAWATEQLYPGLNSNNTQGWYEFTDFPILQADLGEHKLIERGLLTGEILNAYVRQYADHFGLTELIRLRTQVLKASHDKSKSRPWNLLLQTAQDNGTQSLSAITCSKLIVATGQAAKPLIPSFPGADSFRSIVMHAVDLGPNGPAILSDKSKSHITVLGGSKSAHDAVYMFASAGKKVTWLTRRSGRGLAPMAKVYTQMGPWSVWLEGLLMTRSLALFGPAPWSTGDGFGWLRWLLHGTAAGRWLVRGYWAGLGGDSLAQSGILREEKTKALVPDESMMWYGTQAACLTYETDFYELVNRENVNIVREDVKMLDGSSIVLENGQRIETDVLYCATGYKYGATFPIESQEGALALGMPVPPENDDMYPKLEAKADIELFGRFPELKNSPQTTEKQPGLTPWRLWRFIAPPSQVCKQRNVVFLNTITSYQTLLKCEITSLWAYAYLNDDLTVDPGSEDAVRYEATLWSRFGRWSRPMGMKGKIADFFMDAMPYYDLLLRDLGLQSWRKGWGVFGELFGKWYELNDYRGLLDEWKAMRQATHKKTA